MDYISFIGIEKLQITGSGLADNLNASSITGSAIMNGGAGNDSLTGTFAADSVAGGTGERAYRHGLIGAAEIDTLTGGTGNDVFVLGTTYVRLYDDNATGGGTAGYALITDFTAGDKLQLKGTAAQYFRVSRPPVCPPAPPSSTTAT